jgi:hypothetical protein
MIRSSLLSIVLFAASCSTSTPRREIDLAPYLDGYAVPPAVEPAEFEYENPHAKLRFDSPDEPVTFEQIEAESLEGGLDWPTPSRAALSGDDDYDPNVDFGYYGNEYGGAGRRGVRRPRPRPEPQETSRPPQPEPDSGKDLGQTPAPDVGPEGRRRAKTPPERPDRSDPRSPPARRQR